MRLLGTLTVLALVVLLKDASANSKYRKLIKKVMNKLSPDVIPFGRKNEAVNVSMRVTLIDITGVNSHTNQIEIETWLDYSWNSGISWSREKFDFANVKINEADLWKPDMTSYNGYRRLENQAPPFAVLSYDGRVSWVPKTRIDAKCQISSKRLSVNETCDFKIGSWTSSGSEIHLQEPEGDVDLSHFNNPKYKVLEVKLLKDVKTYPCCPEAYENYRLVLSFARKDRNERTSEE